MAKLEHNTTVHFTDGARIIADAIDRARREAVQRRNNARSAEGEAYYEGQRVALAELQAFVEKVTAI